MISSTSSARGKQLFNSLLTMAGLVVVVVAGVAFYANTKEFKDIYVPAQLPLTNDPTQEEVSQQTTIPDFKLAGVPKANPSLSASSNPNSRWKNSYRTYRAALQIQEPERMLYLAVPSSIYELFFATSFIQDLVGQNQLYLVSYDLEREVIERWQPELC